MKQQRRTTVKHVAPELINEPQFSTQRPSVAVIGGGQLARMLHEAASPLSVNVRALVEAADGSAALANPHYEVGLPTDTDTAALERILAVSDVLTFEHEHIPSQLFDYAEGRIPVRPSREALLYAQDKLAMRRRLSDIGVLSPRWREINALSDLDECGEELGYPFIVKTPRGGYDGHGVLVVKTPEDVAQAQDSAQHISEEAGILGGGISAKGARMSIIGEWLKHGSLLAEEMVNFYDELSVQVARRPNGDMTTWTPVRSEQLEGVCSIVTAPAPDLSEEDAQRADSIARYIAEELDVTGVLAVEMFRVRTTNDDGSISDHLLVNELAMRPHNTGHWTIEGARTSQFEQHLRAVLDLPLGSTEMTATFAVMVNLLGSELRDPTDALSTAMQWAPLAKIHLYGKEVRNGRKLGHLTVCCEDPDIARQQAYAAMSALAGDETPRPVPPPPQPALG